MKLNLKLTYIGLDKEIIKTGKSYALATKETDAGGKDVYKPLFVDEAETKVPVIEKSGGNLTIREVISRNLLAETKTEKISKAALGYKILLEPSDEFEIGETDLTLIKKTIEESEYGMILHQTLQHLKA